MKKQIIFFTVSLLIILFVSCNNHPETVPASGNGDKHLVTKDTLEKFAIAFNNGEQIFKYKCAACHAPPHQRVEPGSEPNALDKIPPDSLRWYLNYVKDSRPFKGRESAESQKFLKEFPGNYEHVFKDSLNEGQINNLMFYLLGAKY